MSQPDECHTDEPDQPWPDFAEIGTEPFDSQYIRDHAEVFNPPPPLFG